MVVLEVVFVSSVKRGSKGGGGGGDVLLSCCGC